MLVDFGALLGLLRACQAQPASPERATAGAPRTAMQKGYDAVLIHMTMFINDSELQWRYICSRTFIKP